MIITENFIGICKEMYYILLTKRRHIFPAKEQVAYVSEIWDMKSIKEKKKKTTYLYIKHLPLYVPFVPLGHDISPIAFFFFFNKYYVYYVSLFYILFFQCGNKHSTSCFKWPVTVFYNSEFLCFKGSPEENSGLVSGPEVKMS